MLTMVHENHVFVNETSLFVDRKFHVGMQKYLEQLRVPICTVNPSNGTRPTAIDVIEVPLQDAGYSVMPLQVSEYGGLSAAEAMKLQGQIQRSSLIYGNPNSLGWHHIARRLGKPYIMMIEYDLDTRLRILWSQKTDLIRKGWRAARCTVDYFARDMRSARSAHEVHCNGYPIFDATQGWAKKRLLYLDSRLSREDVISSDELESRLVERRGQTLKLLFSGRYEPLKGAVDVVKVALEGLRRGYDIELHCYGMGEQKSEMVALASQREAGGRIKIFDAVPFPKLLAEARKFDVFVCCHIQNDPSCTYLESFGCGLPIVGYDNRMWKGLLRASGAGLSVPLGDVSKLADAIGRLAVNNEEIDSFSRRARAFAVEHCFENEFRLRIDALQSALSRFHTEDVDRVSML